MRKREQSSIVREAAAPEFFDKFRLAAQCDCRKLGRRRYPVPEAFAPNHTSNLPVHAVSLGPAVRASATANAHTPIILLVCLRAHHSNPKMHPSSAAQRHGRRRGCEGYRPPSGHRERQVIEGVDVGKLADWLFATFGPDGYQIDVERRCIIVETPRLLKPVSAGPLTPPPSRLRSNMTPISI